MKKNALLLSLVLVLVTAATSAAEDFSELPTISAFTAGMQRIDGYFPLYVRPQTAQVWLEIPAGRWNDDLLFMVSLPRGIGSNDIGVDRGQIRSSRIVRFQRAGRRALLIAPAMDFRAEGGGASERRSVEEAFARSVIWSLTIVAEEEGRVLADANHFVSGDHAGIADTLRAAQQGSYERDPDRCVPDLAGTKAFPLNTEIEAILTFSGRPEGAWIRSVTPDARSVTVNQRLSLIRLPDDGYRRRADDPRSGYYGISFSDYSAPIDRPLVQRFIARHRLEKKNPGAAMSEPVEPIVYYVDSGAPEPVRTALVEGASWWNAAFEAAGFRNAFQVKLLPEDADPLDLRYNVIQWVHRSTRGWSYGHSVLDPRTGEIIKGHVSLGSLRVRQDYLIATALTSPYADGENAPPELREMALARIRQLSAHEVGHTLGLRHNYISSVTDRASVMDYPHPLITLKEDGSLDFSQAYTEGIGDWDKLAIRYGYQEFAPEADEAAALRSMLDIEYSSTLRYITDADARPTGGAHPLAHLWDNGSDPAAELRRVLAVRTAALAKFGPGAIRVGVPLSELEQVLVPLYFSHRYQVEAAVKVIGGVEYEYGLRSVDHVPPRVRPAAGQEEALKAVLACLSPETLTLPDAILNLIPPPAPGYDRNRESMPGAMGPILDPLAAADSAATMVLDLLLHPHRANRLVVQQARFETLPNLETVLGGIGMVTVIAEPGSGLQEEILRTTSAAAIRAVMRLARDPETVVQARASAMFYLDEWARTYEMSPSTEVNHRTRIQLAREIRRFLADPDTYVPARDVQPPPGSPIGAEAACGHENWR